MNECYRCARTLDTAEDFGAAELTLTGDPLDLIDLRAFGGRENTCRPRQPDCNAEGKGFSCPANLNRIHLRMGLKHAAIYLILDLLYGHCERKIIPLQREKKSWHDKAKP